MKTWEIAFGDDRYPRCLAEADAAPERLYGIGDPNALGAGLAIVGARSATPYGLAAARMFASWAAEHGLVIISGAARGCDHQAQTAALDAGGQSVAVMGCGADVDYPRSSGPLLDRLRAGGGAVISELPWGTPPARWTFVRRNRIIASLATAVLVVEAGLPSGTFSTADFALDRGRDVLAVPGSIFSPTSRGANRLICNGAMPVTEVSDLAAALHGVGVPVTRGDPIDDRVLAAFLADPMRPDDAARQLRMDIVELSRSVGSLEAAGRLVRYPDGRYGAG